MSYYYTAPTALVDATPPQAPHDRVISPDDPTLSVVVVSYWPATADRDAWEALPGVTEYPLWTWGQPAPPSLATVKLGPGATVQQAFRRMGIRH